MQHEPRIFLERVDLVVLDDGRHLSNCNYEFMFHNHKSEIVRPAM